MSVSSSDPVEVDIAERKKKLMLLTPVDPTPQPQGGLARQVCNAQKPVTQYVECLEYQGSTRCHTIIVRASTDTPCM